MADLMNVDPKELRKQLQEYMDSLETFEDKMKFALQLHSMRKTDATGEIDVLPGIEDAIKDVEQSLFYRHTINGGVDEDYMKQSIHDFNKNMIAMQVSSSNMIGKDHNSLHLDDYYKMTDLFEIYEEFREGMISKDHIKEIRSDDYRDQLDQLSGDDYDDYRKYYIRRDEAIADQTFKDVSRLDMTSREVDAEKAYKFITEELLQGKVEYKKKAEAPVYENINAIDDDPEPVAEEETMSEEYKRVDKKLDGLQSYGNRLIDIQIGAEEMLREYNELKNAKSNNSDEFKKLGEALEEVSKLNAGKAPLEIEESLAKLKKAANDYNARIDGSIFRGVLGGGRNRRDLSGRLASFAEESTVSLNAVYPEGATKDIALKAQTEETFNEWVRLGTESPAKKEKAPEKEAETPGKNAAEPAKAEPEKKEGARDEKKSRKIDLSEMKQKEDESKGRKSMDPQMKKELYEKQKEIMDKRREANKKAETEKKTLA